MRAAQIVLHEHAVRDQIFGRFAQMLDHRGKEELLLLGVMVLVGILANVGDDVPQVLDRHLSALEDTRAHGPDRIAHTPDLHMLLHHQDDARPRGRKRCRAHAHASSKE